MSHAARALLALLLAATALALPDRADAHRQPSCLSTLTWDPAAQRLEIVHRLHVHDVERALEPLFGEAGLRIVDLEPRARFALYLEQHFGLRSALEPTVVIPLALVGAELDGSQLLVFQEYTGPLPTSLEARSDVLRALVPEQRNQLLVRTPQQTRRFEFADDVIWQAFSLAPDEPR
ncbi:MAG: DUF6702 family protein [Pseudomonadota bacterium]